ncbi:Cyclic nucleotide-binding domain-containing protein [Aphelenchoides besseyi]|nr:Cyclic nucleotide-binding domain-containing protein [Aphelenchoides besseyi]KAI6211829.1 Cyclic nucleotide-binding domain-containing protein [Aphelenchoides besseyi]
MANEKSEAWKSDNSNRPTTSSDLRNRRALYVQQSRNQQNVQLPGTPIGWRSVQNIGKRSLNLPRGSMDAVQLTVLSPHQTTKEEPELKVELKLPQKLLTPEIAVNEQSTEGEEPSTSTGTTRRPPRKFKSLAKSLSVLSRIRGSDHEKPMSREQHAFLNKYGMHMENATAQTIPKFQGSKWEFLKSKFIVDPSSDFYFYWTWTVAIAYLYNLFFVVYRCVFLKTKVEPLYLILLIILDIITDAIYAIDMFFRSRTGFLEQGLLVRDVRKTWRVYKKSAQFKFDFASTLPFDYVYEFVFQTTNPVLRFNRLIRLERVTYALNATESRISIPNFFRIGCVVLYILVLIHWNACAYFFMSDWIGLDTDSWVYGKKNIQSLPPGVPDSLTRRYVYAFYWSTLVLTTVGEVPGPVINAEFIFVTIDLMCGVLIFATIVGNVGSMISNMSAARSEFQNQVDGIKQYMSMRKVGQELEERVIKWFDYLWSNKQSINDQQALDVLPTKLQAEIAMHVHFETLRKVRIFQDCEAGLLAELVLKLQLQVYSPRDFVCRKGDIGREMYIVKRGRLQVVGDDGTTVLHTLQEGAVFGELSILNISGSKQGNRRSASIRSVGYTDLFGREILQKDNLLDENAPLETKTADEVAEELQALVTTLQTRLARLTAEHVSNEAKLKSRVEYLEQQLKRHGDEGFFDDD